MQDAEGVDATQTQGGPDVLFSSNITRQQLLEKEEQFKVGSLAHRCMCVVPVRLLLAVVQLCNMQMSCPQAGVCLSSRCCCRSQPAQTGLQP